MNQFLLTCILTFSFGYFGCGTGEYECPEGYSEQLMTSFGFTVCLPSTWTGEEMNRMDPVSGQEMTHYIYRQEPLPGKPLIGLEMFDFWGFEDDFQSFEKMSKEDAQASGQDMRKVEKGKTENGTPYWMTELGYLEGSKELMAQNYYFFPEGDYSRAFIMRAFCLKEAFPACQDTFQIVSQSFSY